MADSDALTVIDQLDPKPPARVASPTFCVRLWQHMHLQANGELLACCLFHGGPVTQDGVAVSTNRQSLMEIWNADTLRDLRRAMVEGERITGCDMCYAAEERGGESIRQFDNRTWESNWANEPRATIDEMIATAIDNDFRLPKLPEMIDFQAASLCNLKCRMCNSANSSKIAKDTVQRSWEPKEVYPHEDPTFKWLRSMENLVDELAKDTGSEVRRLSFAGGEPLLLREIPTLLERLIAAGRAQLLSLTFISNGSIVPRWLSLAPQFRRFDLIISIDGYADHYDYIRYPGRWSKLTRNLQLFRKIPNIHVQATITIQVNNVLSLTNLFRYLDAVGIGFDGYLLFHPMRLAVNILPASVRRVAAARLLDYAETDCHPHHRELVRSFAAQIESGDDTGDRKLLREFMLFSNDLDASRGQSIHSTDPELVALLEQAGFPWIDETLHAPPNGAALQLLRRIPALMPAQNEALKLHHDLAITIKSLRDELTQTQAELTQKSDELRMRKEQASLQLAQLYASRSWRLTRPLRAVGRRLRRWRQASSAAGRPATG
jgi:MoaA/NifB/PqqE/SkfB family radical SAM enzyme